MSRLQAHAGGCVWKTFRCAIAGVALITAAAALSACDSSATQGDAAASISADVGQLQQLERPVVRHLKLGFTALRDGRQAEAAEELERASGGGGAVLEWLDRHEVFAHANEDAVGCLEESLPELDERAERLIPQLRKESVTAADHRQLRIRIAEAVNCIQASD
jgi:hypothetical protein